LFFVWGIENGWEKVQVGPGKVLESTIPTRQDVTFLGGKSKKNARSQRNTPSVWLTCQALPGGSKEGKGVRLDPSNGIYPLYPRVVGGRKKRMKI